MCTIFRKAQAIYRWQEGRNLWSNIQSTVRSFMRLSSSVLEVNSHFENEKAIEEFVGLILAFPVALKWVYPCRDIFLTRSQVSSSREPKQRLR